MAYWQAAEGHDDALLAERLLGAIRGLRRWRRGEQAALHKPLLLIVALTRIRRGLPRLVSFPDLEQELAPLLRAFVGPYAHAEYPFWRLHADGLWDIPNAAQLSAWATNADPPVGELRARGTLGGLPVPFDALLRRRVDLLEEAVDLVLEAYIPAARRGELLAAVGWNDTTVAIAEDEKTEGAVAVGVPYKERDLPPATRTVRSYQVDPDAAGRGAHHHELTLRQLVAVLKAEGISPLLPGVSSPLYDLAWKRQATLFVAEVKSLTPANEERQLRVGLGQVLRYRQNMRLRHPDRHVVAVLAVEARPADPTWQPLCDELNVRLVWPEAFSALIG